MKPKTLSDYGEVLMDFDSMIRLEDFHKEEDEGFGIFYPEDKVKEFIKKLKAPKHTPKNWKSEDGSKFILITHNELDELTGDLT